MKIQIIAALSSLFIAAAHAQDGKRIEVVTVGDVQWAQVDQFTGLSGDAIARVCPAGDCDSGTGEPLAGFDMSGWRWASSQEVETLLSQVTPYAGAEFAETDSTWAPAFFDQHGFRATTSSDAGRALMGRTSSANDIYRNVTIALSDFSDPTIGDAITAEYWTPHHYTYANIGAFFYRKKE